MPCADGARSRSGPKSFGQHLIRYLGEEKWAWGQATPPFGIDLNCEERPPVN